MRIFSPSRSAWGFRGIFRLRLLFDMSTGISAEETKHSDGVVEISVASQAFTGVSTINVISERTTSAAAIFVVSPGLS